MATPVKSIMTTKIFTVPKGTSIAAAHDVMKEKRIRHLPVTLGEGEDIEIVGILSQRDLTVVSNADQIPVEFLMSTPIEFAPETLSLRKAVLRMLEKKVSCLIIVNEGAEAVGIVTTDDVLWYLAHLLKSDEDSQQSLLNVLNLETLGKVASKLSDMGV